jgi:hypothetical protein
MRSDRIRGYCPHCGHHQLFEKSEIHHGVHLFLSIITVGLWLVSWISIVIGHKLRPWRCLQCGWHTPLFGAREPAPGTEKADRVPEGVAKGRGTLPQS